MLVRASAVNFKESLSALQQNERQVAVSFRVEEGCLYMQVNKGIILERAIPVTYDTKEDVELTVILDKAVSLLRGGKELVELYIEKDSLRIVQEGFQLTALRVAGRSVEVDTSVCQSSLDLGSLYRLTLGATELSEAAKTIGESESSVDVVDGWAYILNSNIAFSSKADLPNLRVSTDSVRSLRKVLGEGAAKYYLDRDKGLLTIKQEQAVIVIPTPTGSYERARSVQRLVDESALTFVGEIHIAEYVDMLKTVCSLYRKRLLDLSVTEDGIGVFVNSISAHIAAGSKSSAKCVIRLNTAQLRCIGQIFMEDERISVWKGENRLCLKNRYKDKMLVMSGMLY